MKIYTMLQIGNRLSGYLEMTLTPVKLYLNRTMFTSLVTLQHYPPHARGEIISFLHLTNTKELSINMIRHQIAFDVDMNSKFGSLN